MALSDLLRALNSGRPIAGSLPLHEVMHRTSQEALRITAKLNGSYHEPATVRELLAELTGRPIDVSVTIFPPFHSDFGKNITLGNRVFINSSCKFQNLGGITIGDGCLIGHNTVIATLNHDLAPQPARRHAPSLCCHRPERLDRVERDDPGVRQDGNNAVVAAAAVVTTDVPDDTVVVGSPARVVRTLIR
uniref:sugar O-acetyltransferase n=1 Tax=Georgenia subflava TaxID=1622177 RepID=UPI001D005CB2|nr:sugar O-acetyltransferase [Georgenia subflava]